MPKISFGVDVEEAAFGKIIRKLNAMPGVMAIHMDFGSKPKQPHGNNGPRAPYKRFSEPGYVFLTKALRGGKAMTATQMKELFGSNGRSPGSYASAHHNARRGGLITKGKVPGTWTAAKDADKKLAAVAKAEE